MGYLISSLTDPSITPKILNEYCIYLISEWALKGVAKSISKEFREYSMRIGNHASIFAASDQDSYNNSLYDLLNKDPWFKSTIGDFYDLSPGIIITKPGLPQFSASSDQVFIYVADEVINLAYHDPTTLSQDLVELCRHNDKRFINKLLPYSRGAIVSPGPQTNVILDLLDKSIIIEPNINGFGVKVKPIADYARNAFHRNLHPDAGKPKYDCVIYQF